MTCSLLQTLMEPYLDGELDANRQAQITEHLLGCADCTERYRELEQLRGAIRNGGLYYTAPDELRARVTRVLENAVKPATIWTWKWLAFAASVLLVFSLAANLLMSRRGSQGQEIASEIVSEHVRSMMGGHLTEVVSSDRHTVKPWFGGRLDFSPEVKDLAPQGYPLVGGRTDYIDGRTVAALIFHRNQHVITLFTWPSARRARTNSWVNDGVNGYNVVEWEKDAMIYWAVSDLNRSELKTFADYYQR